MVVVRCDSAFLWKKEAIGPGRWVSDTLPPLEEACVYRPCPLNSEPEALPASKNWGTGDRFAPQQDLNAQPMEDAEGCLCENKTGRTLGSEGAARYGLSSIQKVLCPRCSKSTRY